MIPAFWDASAVVPLCCQQPSTAAARLLLQRYHLVVWWSTAVEMQSAFERLSRSKVLSLSEHARAGRRLQKIRRGWREIQPSDALRNQAEDFLAVYTLKAADALQLAAAFVWCAGSPATHTFISGDKQLIEAARKVGFQVKDPLAKPPVRPVHSLTSTQNGS